MVAKTLKHKFVSAQPNDPDATLIQTQRDWNDEHNLQLGKRTVTAATDTLLDADHLCLIQYNRSTAIAVAVPQAGASSQFISGWVTFIRNLGAGAVTFTPAISTINEQASLTLQGGDYAILFSDGTNYAMMVIRGGGLPTGGTVGQVLTKNTSTDYDTSWQVAPVAPQCGRLSYVNTTTLQFLPLNGDKIKINGVIYSIPVGSIVGLGVSGVFVNGVAGQNLAASTTYYVYCFNNAGNLTADYSATGHATSTTAGNVGVEIKSGDNTRTLIGMCRTNASSQFQNDVQNRFVRSWFNADKQSLVGSLTADRNITSTGVTEFNSESRCNFLVWTGELLMVHVAGGAFQTSATAIASIFAGMDGTSVGSGSPVNSTGATIAVAPVAMRNNLSEGLHYITIMGMAGNAGATLTMLGTGTNAGTVFGALMGP